MKFFNGETTKKIKAVGILMFTGLMMIAFSFQYQPQASPSVNAVNLDLTETNCPLGLDCTYGPDTCKQGYVWREADARDLVCVTPETREQTKRDNRLARYRREPNGGIYGSNTCKQGFVWREAFGGDTVCVTPETRSQAKYDNRQAARRRSCDR